MPKVSINPNSVPALAGEIAAFTSGASDNLRLDDLLTALAGVVAPGLALNCNVRLSQGLGQNIVAARTQFVEAQRTVLAGQGFTSVSDQALTAFFFSALYEELRFESTLFNERESPSSAPGGRRPRPKRRGAAYFTPPSLAYLAAHRALGAYFDGGAHDRLPKIFDPAMGTGLYLVAALDYLDSLDTLPVPLPAAAGDASRRAALAGACLYGADFDAITCGAAKLCLAIAAGELEAVQNNISWEDSTVLSDGNAGKFDIVLSNPPWDLVKSAQAGSGGARVNQARIATLRRGLEYQGEGDTSYYKIFLELTTRLLRPGGVAALLVPNAFCGDKGAAQLRRLLLERCALLSLDGFINEDCAFAIHQYFKYVLLCFKTDAQTASFTTRFGLVAGLSQLLGGDAQSAGLTCSLSEVEQLGGQSLAILELTSSADMEQLCRLYGSHGNFKNFLDASGVSLRREFDMTLDRRRFLRKLRVPQKSEYLPLYEGRMIAQFEAKKESAAPRFFVSREDFRRRVPENCIRVGFVSVSSALNTRSMIAALLPDLPAGNSLPTVVFRSGEHAADGINSARSLALYTVAIFNSFVFDWILRLRLSGNNLSYHLLEDLPFPEPGSLEPALFALCVHLSGRLSLEAPDPVSRLRLRVWLEMLVMHIYGIDPDFAGHILRDCRLPTEQLARRRRLSRLNSNQPEPRGFFRVDKELEPDYRLTNLVLSAYGQLHTSSGEFGRLLEQLEPTSPVLLPAAVEAALERRCVGTLL